MSNKKKKTFGRMFSVICDGKYYPRDEKWENLIAKTENNGWNNPSGQFHSRSNMPDIEGKIIGFHIPPKAKIHHPKFAFIKNKKGLFAIKFWKFKNKKTIRTTVLAVLILYY